MTDPNLVPIPEGLGVDHIELLEDENGDGSVNPGESARVAVYVKNTGSSLAQTVSGDVKGTPSQVYWSSLSAMPGKDATDYSYMTGDYTADIGPGEVVDLLHVSFEVLPDATPGLVIFTVVFRDGHGNEWLDEFELQVQATSAALAVDHVVLLEDENGDGSVNPGESARVAVYVKNTGSSLAQTVSGDVMDTPSQVVSLSTSQGVDATDYSYMTGDYTADIAPGEVVDLLHVYFDVRQDTPPGPITFVVTIRDGHGNEWQDEFNVQVVP